MNKYIITIKEIFSRDILVTADSMEEARNIVHDNYEHDVIELDINDYSGTEFTTHNEERTQELLEYYNEYGLMCNVYDLENESWCEDYVQ